MNRRKFLSLLACLVLAPKLARMERDLPVLPVAELSDAPTALLTQEMLDQVFQDLTCGYTETIYSLKTKDGKWQWRTDDGQEMSPVFDSEEEALASHANHGNGTFCTYPSWLKLR